MTNEQINIAIAEACGWEWRVGIYGNCRGLFHQDDEYLKSYKCTVEQMNDLPISSDCAGRVPDYCNDLNAMHEAEKKLIFSERKLFRYWLQKVKGSEVGDGVEIALDECVHASARQRAEAFLRTIGKWEGEE